MGQASKGAKVFKVLNQGFSAASLLGGDPSACFLQNKPCKLRVINLGGIEGQRNVCGELSKVRINALQCQQGISLSSSDG